MKRRLLFIVNVDWFFLSHRLPLALAAKEAGLDVHVATSDTGSASDIARHGFTVHPVRIDRQWSGPVAAMQLTIALYQLMHRLSPDVVHLVTIKSVLFGGIAARVARVPRVVAAISGLGFVFTANGKWAAIRRMAVALLYRMALAHPAVRVIFQNEDDQSLIQRLAGIRTTQSVRIRGSGVDVRRWPVLPLPSGPPVVLMASRLLVDKGVREFVEAARILRGYADVRFVLVGDVDSGNPTSLSNDEVRRWTDQGLISWLGHRRDMPHVLAQAHVVVLPSYREGLPKALIEAAASGRAVVTTDVPGCRDAIEPGRTGLLVPARDAQALAQAIRVLLDDPLMLRRFGESGRILAESVFDIRNVVGQHLKLYQAN